MIGVVLEVRIFAVVFLLILKEIIDYVLVRKINNYSASSKRGYLAIDIPTDRSAIPVNISLNDPIFYGFV